MTRNSEFIKHKPCPNCGSKDNLAEYTDHDYCFGCGFTSKSKPRIRTTDDKTRPVSIALPDDCEPYIPAIASDWMNQYGITQNELIANRVLYSESRTLLVFPYFASHNQLLGWQGRYFGTNPKHPKWFTKGYIKDFIHILNLDKARKSGTIVYVEDIVSAIKVGRVYGSVPVFGSFINRTHSIRLGKLGITKFLCWLDPDKFRESHKFAREINDMGYKAYVVESDKDPKDYSTDNIKLMLDKF